MSNLIPWLCLAAFAALVFIRRRMGIRRIEKLRAEADAKRGGPDRG